MERKGKLYQQDTNPRESYEKPRIFSEEVEIGVYGQYAEELAGMFPACCATC